MQYLVTGSTGFIGSQIVNELISQGNEVLALCNLNKDYLNPDAEYIQADIRDLKSIKEICEANSITGIYHFAFMMDVRKSMSHPNLVHDVNVTGTLNILQAARDSGINRVLFPSSAAVYGNDSISPKTEKSTLHPVSFYALSKQIAEMYVNSFSDFYGMSTIILRYFNVYGPGQNPKSTFMTTIPLFIQKILSGENLTIYGDGKQTRDFVYIKDVVDSTIQAMNSGTTGTYNIGSGTETSINQVLSIIQDFMDTKFDIQYLPAQEGEIKRSVADISAAQKSFNYNPKMTLKEGIENTIRYLELLRM